jgi:dsRNA-specific ribonuclease
MASGLYDGIRGDLFHTLIHTILKNNNVHEKYSLILLHPKNFSYFCSAFTDPSYDSDNNYIALSSLGHQTLTKTMMWFFPKKFQRLFSVDCKGVLNDLKSKHVEGKSVGKYIENTFGIWDFISMSQVTRLCQTDMKNEIVQKTVEAILASIEIILDQHLSLGVGYDICNQFMQDIMGKIHISFKHEELYSRVSVLNVLKSSIQKILKGTVSFEDVELADGNGQKIYQVSAYLKTANGSTLLGQGIDHIKSIAKEMAAVYAVQTLQKYQITYNPPRIYNELEQMYNKV